MWCRQGFQNIKSLRVWYNKKQGNKRLTEPWKQIIKLHSSSIWSQFHAARPDNSPSLLYSFVLSRVSNNTEPCLVPSESRGDGSWIFFFHIQVSSQKSVSSRAGSTAANRLQQAAAACKTHWVTLDKKTQSPFDSLNLYLINWMRAEQIHTNWAAKAAQDQFWFGDTNQLPVPDWWSLSSLVQDRPRENQNQIGGCKSEFCQFSSLNLDRSLSWSESEYTNHQISVSLGRRRQSNSQGLAVTGNRKPVWMLQWSVQILLENISSVEKKK